MSSRAKGWLLCLTTAICCAVATPSLPAQHIKAKVICILATDQNHRIDEKIACIANEVQKLKNYQHLTGFRQANIICQSMVVGKAKNFVLVDRQVATVTILDMTDPTGKVRLRVKPPTLGNITYSTRCGKCLPLITRYKTKKKELLILAVLVVRCKKAKR